jgi:dihydroorotase
VPAGNLSLNSDADICIFDANEYWKISANALKSQGKNTPFNGLEMAGKVKFTLVHGQLVYQS